MLDSSVALNWRAQYRKLIYDLGAPATWSNADGSLRLDLTIGFRSLGRDEYVLINAYGAKAKALTVFAEDLPTVPDKFDTFSVRGEDYVVQAPPTYVYMHGEVIGYRLIAAGR